jgi:hypothetical protein
MSIVETTLVFVGIPAAVVLVVTALVYARSNERTPRYRPGGPWQFNPVWYLPHPEHAGPVSSLHSAGSNPHAAALDGAGARPALPGQVAETVTASGGASGEW